MPRPIYNYFEIPISITYAINEVHLPKLSLEGTIKNDADNKAATV